ncbi:MAG TPA: hypothetical protein VGG39_27400 [Polyangiaceae bacterium]|jgi:Meckel syndrome type 1 protein
MSERTGKPDALDAALAAWPAVAGSERSTVEWDEVAETVVARAEEAVSGRIFGAPTPVSEEDLLRSPLPASPEEVQSSAAVARGSEGPAMTTTSRERDRATLKDLARMAQMTAPSSGRISAPPASGTQPAGEATKEDSGLINLAAIAAADAPAPAEAQAKPVVRLPDGATPEMMSTLRSATERPKPAPGAPAAAATKKRTPWVAVSGLVAAAAVAAGAFFGMQHAQRTAPAAVAAAPVAQPPAATATAPAAASLATPIPPGDLGVDPSTLPAAGSLAAHGPVPSSAKPTAAFPQPATTAAPAAPTTPPALVAAVPPPAPAASGSAQGLLGLMQQAAGVTSGPAAAPTATADTPEAPAPGSVPLKPSQGAISGALGAALPGARGCLGPDDPISHATVTFRSDGSVQNVGVSGGAAGKPAEACIRSALSKARVAPFAQPTFTASTTVRPN